MGKTPRAYGGGKKIYANGMQVMPCVKHYFNTYNSFSEPEQTVNEALY